ncbi:MAG TPA: hypothetical protein VJA16_20870 [Thermoanaerobaculia bacterium]
MADQLTEYLRARQGPQPDMVSRNAWLEAIGSLYADIRGWLSEPEKEGLVNIVDADKVITERLLGTYDAPVLQLLFADHQVVIVPVARYVIGGGGRVDMTLGPRSFMLIWGGDGWQILPRDKKGPPSALNKDAFSEALQVLLG